MLFLLGFISGVVSTLAGLFLDIVTDTDEYPMPRCAGMALTTACPSETASPAAPRPVSRGRMV
jgi:hypothetical protein